MFNRLFYNISIYSSEGFFGKAKSSDDKLLWILTGIIDFFQEYGIIKQVENISKSALAYITSGSPVNKC